VGGRWQEDKIIQVARIYEETRGEFGA